MKIYYSDLFAFPLPADHRFPIDKYARLRNRILAVDLVVSVELLIPDPVTDEQLLLIHDRKYLERVKSGRLTPGEIREIGFPWSPQLVERSRRSVGGTLSACRAALEDGMAVNLAGGTHHAFPDRGQGFCIFNDTAVAARSMQQEGIASRVVILDCDVHQGNGTAAIFSGDPTVFTFSIHGERNFPFRKTEGDLDIGLPDGAEDETFLAALVEGLNAALDESNPDLAIYLAGADPYKGDRLGRLSVSKAGLLERDHLVFELCARRGLPVATVMGGGYARDIDETVEIHFNTVVTALEWSRRLNSLGQEDLAESAAVNRQGNRAEPD